MKQEHYALADMKTFRARVTFQNTEMEFDVTGHTEGMAKTRAGSHFLYRNPHLDKFKGNGESFYEAVQSAMAEGMEIVLSEKL